MTRILIITIGSRGDIQPFVALGQRLLSAGYEVALQTAESYRPFVEGHGVPYVHMNNDFMELTESKSGQAATEGKNSLALIREVMPRLRSMLHDEWAAAQAFRPDAIIYHPKSLGSRHIAEALKILAIMSLSLPLSTPTRAYPTPIMSGLKLGGAFNRLSYKVVDLATAPYAGMINEFRQTQLGLPKAGRFASDLVTTSGQPVPVLYAYSPHVVPVPEDYPASVHVTGYWFLEADAAWKPSQELLRFLEAGAPPVYVGFGSMSGAKAQARAQMVIEALKQAGQRGVLASGWGGLKAAELPESIFMLDQAPHDWLFPRMAAVVHHGGAGTTAAGLRAGKPSIIVPFIADQPFWGRVVHDLGAGPSPIPQKRLSVEGLSAAIRQATTDPAMRAKAEALGAKLRAEDGLANAVAALGRLLARPVAVASP